MTLYRLRIRYARFEGKRLVRYPPGAQIELSEGEASALRYSSDPVVPSTTAAPAARPAAQRADAEPAFHFKKGKRA